jgi:glutathione S-transferase
LTTAAGLLFASSPVVVRVDGFAGSGWTAAAAADDGRRRSAAAAASSFCDATATALSAAASPKRDQGNPFSSFIGDVASSLLGGGEGMRSNAAVDEALARAEGVPSWSDVRSQLESLQQTPEERLFRRNLDGGYGAASPLHEMRLFDESNGEEDVRVTFYRDSASWVSRLVGVAFLLPVATAAESNRSFQTCDLISRPFSVRTVRRFG